MRKRMMTRPTQTSAPLAQEWLDLQSAASVEMTSEDASFPIESALLQREKGGWRATEPGVQTIRLIFDEPQKLRRIWLAFAETETSRTQEFTVRWSPDRGNSFREIVRQQWNFSLPDATHETEDYTVKLSGVAQLDPLTFQFRLRCTAFPVAQIFLDDLPKIPDGLLAVRKSQPKAQPAR